MLSGFSSTIIRMQSIIPQEALKTIAGINSALYGLIANGDIAITASVVVVEVADLNICRSWDEGKREVRE